MKFYTTANKPKTDNNILVILLRSEGLEQQ
ncbi:Uncharacterised protein [Mammaliicoccus stepanovicii]|uniref:Uncharacterized protein n=1 Tax=Mammaliicoccus stepanovicii TaxID=643214 RepID=A0A239YRL9_9STAP|nr:Uncharacterised protein [Mammaliicoccus stepanovicii]